MEGAAYNRASQSQSSFNTDSPSFAYSPQQDTHRTMATTSSYTYDPFAPRDGPPTTDLVPYDPRAQEYSQHQLQTMYSSPSNSGEHGVDLKLEEMRRRRKQRTIAMGVTGGMVGLIAGGPIGMVAGGYIGARATKAVGKHNERRFQAKRDESTTLHHPGADML